MDLTFAREPLVEDDETIRSNLQDVPVAQLLAAVAHLTGEYDILRTDLRPDLSRALATDPSHSPEQVELAIKLATDALSRYRDRGCPEPAQPDSAQLHQLIDFIAGGAQDPDFAALLTEELALGGADLRAPSWRIADFAPGRKLRIAVIGAGMSGIVAAYRLNQVGAEVQIFEKNEDAGGTWWENAYPGCRVDVPSHLYSYAFAQTPHWPQFNSTQPVLHDYFRTCVERFGLSDRIQYGAEVVAAQWNDDRQTWQLRVRQNETEELPEFDAVVSAVGQLNRPSWPDIPGIKDFRGRSFHSARWNYDVDMTGKRVAVIGTGASAVQFIPWLAERAQHVTIHQRTPPWLLPIPTYQADLPPNLRWILRHIPEYARWDRAASFARIQEGMLPLAKVDPGWDMSRGSVSAENDMLRELLTAYYEIAFPDPKLRAKVLPKYPFGAKRMVLDDGTYSQTLQRPNVTLETGTIAAVTEAGVRLDDGREFEYDVIVFATGFQASKFLTPMEVSGVDGLNLHEMWDGDARAYLGVTVPGFPNLFLLYGPNTNIVVNGSIMYFSECGAQYITDCLRLLVERGQTSLNCRKDVHDRYNERIDAATSRRAWGVANVPTWYRNDHGRIAQNWPFNLYEYWRLTRCANPDDYEFA